MVSIEEIKPLTRIKIKTSEETYEGEQIPSEDEKVVILKLDSGYNIGLKKNNIRSVEIMSQDSQTQQESVDKKNKELKSSLNKNLPTIKLLHTGGTIASKVDYKSGGVVADFDPESLLELFPELKEIANIESEFLGNMFSDDFRFAHFNKIAKKITEEYNKGQKKFIVTSGTDFLHYLSSALSFIFKDNEVSVMIVGSQRSSDRGSSDAGMNLICATQFLTNTDYSGVNVCMHETTNDETCVIIPGTNARKMHSSRRDAFKPVNTKPLARVEYKTKKITLIKESPKKPLEEKEPLLFGEKLKIGMIYSRPQFFAEELKVYENFNGLVIAGSGLGHFPITKEDEITEENEKIFFELQNLATKIPIVMATQTINGRVNMNVYTPGRKLQKIGLMGNQSNMTPETTYIKLAYLLSAKIPKEKLNEELLKDYCGEQSENNYYETIN